MFPTKAIFLASGYASFHLSTTAPNPSPRRSDAEKYPIGVRARLVPTWTMSCFKLFLLTTIFCEIAVIFTANPRILHTKALLERIDAQDPTIAYTRRPGLSVWYIAGWLLQITGTLIRLACYRALGRQFTFELAIRDEHKLVTSGAYAVVRHPAYAGSIMVLSGTLLCTFGPGSWISECGWLETVAMQCVAALFAGWASWIMFFQIKRTRVEDDALRDKFRGDWEDWAERVPYRLVPGLF